MRIDWARFWVATFVIIVCAGCSGDDSDEASPAAEKVTATVTATITAPGVTVTAVPSTAPSTPAAPSSPAASPTPKPPPAVPTRIPGEGTFLVGKDVAAGSYRNDGPSPNDGRYCVIFTSTKPNDLGSYLRGSTSKGPAIITVNKGEYVTTQFCKPFTKS